MMMCTRVSVHNLSSHILFGQIPATNGLDDRFQIIQVPVHYEEIDSDFFTSTGRKYLVVV